MTETLMLEEVAAILNMTPSAIYETRKRNIPPGSLAFRRGKRLLWHQTTLQAWIDSPDTQTFDASHALVLEVRGVNRRLDKVIDHLSALRYLAGHEPEVTESE